MANFETVPLSVRGTILPGIPHVFHRVPDINLPGAKACCTFVLNARAISLSRSRQHLRCFQDYVCTAWRHRRDFGASVTIEAALCFARNKSDGLYPISSERLLCFSCCSFCTYCEPPLRTAALCSGAKHSSSELFVPKTGLRS